MQLECAYELLPGGQRKGHDGVLGCKKVTVRQRSGNSAETAAAAQQEAVSENAQLCRVKAHSNEGRRCRISPSRLCDLLRSQQHESLRPALIPRHTDT